MSIGMLTFGRIYLRHYIVYCNNNIMRVVRDGEKKTRTKRAVLKIEKYKRLVKKLLERKQIKPKYMFVYIRLPHILHNIKPWRIHGGAYKAFGVGCERASRPPDVFADRFVFRCVSSAFAGA